MSLPDFGKGKLQFNHGMAWPTACSRRMTVARAGNSSDSMAKTCKRCAKCAEKMDLCKICKDVYSIKW
jgi:hypothetical protein